MRTKQGIVTSAKMQNTVTVAVHRYVMHPQLKKRYRVSKKFLADTAGLTVNEGDEVTITECAPLSKRKHFKVSEIVKKSAQVDQMADDVMADAGTRYAASKKKSDDSASAAS